MTTELDLPEDPTLVEMLAGDNAPDVVWPIGSTLDIKTGLFVAAGVLTAELVRRDVDPNIASLLITGFRFAIICLLVSCVIGWWGWSRRAAHGYIPVALRGRALIHSCSSDCLLFLSLLTFDTAWVGSGLGMLLAGAVVQVFFAWPTERLARRVHADAMAEVLISRSHPFFPRRPVP